GAHEKKGGGDDQKERRDGDEKPGEGEAEHGVTLTLVWFRYFQCILFLDRLQAHLAPLFVQLIREQIA
ncbi:MAG: hypothetical protein MPK75_09620, partial [Alphaproteobacteria bacterium]|nr:hypothetical protein [Alphaproteobacteria bacterium]